MLHVQKYYARSRYCKLLLLFLLGLSSCATLDAEARGAQRVAFRDLPAQPHALLNLPRKPLVLRFDQGTRIPVKFDLDATFLATQQRPLQFELLATRTFYLLLTPKGTARVSLDGVHFAKSAKNSFRFGFHVTQGLAELGLGVALPASAGGERQ
jgi:hypothetical protein